MSETSPETKPHAEEPLRLLSGGARRKRRRVSGCIPVLLVLAVVGALLYFGFQSGKDFIEEQFGDPEDYPGPGKGSVTFEVQAGDSVTEIGQKLEEAGVVASVEAFTDVASDDPRATGIQVGFYPLKKEMKASDALEVLVDPEQIITTRITFPEGLRVVDIVDLFVENTDFGRAQFEKALEKPEKLGLPDYAGGNPEGYLFPSTYGFGPNETPRSMLRAMVDRWKQAAEDADLEGAAERLGYTPHELMTVASLVEAEGRGDDMPKVARVIYNRLENPGTAGTTGRLELDATVNYAHGKEIGARTTSEERQIDSPYNTYLVEGLPPGPIESPGDAAIQAAANPADGDWYYYVTVNLKTGETKFAETPEEHAANVQELNEYCQTSEAC
jgi:UPF0755 protein